MNYNESKFRGAEVNKFRTTKRGDACGTPDMVPLMDRAKRMFYDRTQSDMIRILIVAGLESQNSKEHSDGSKKHFTKRLPDLLGEETAKTF